METPDTQKIRQQLYRFQVIHMTCLIFILFLQVIGTHAVQNGSQLAADIYYIFDFIFPLAIVVETVNIFFASRITHSISTSIATALAVPLSTLLPVLPAIVWFVLPYVILKDAKLLLNIEKHRPWAQEFLRIRKVRTNYISLLIGSIIILYCLFAMLFLLSLANSAGEDDGIALFGIWFSFAVPSFVLNLIYSKKVQTPGPIQVLIALISLLPIPPIIPIAILLAQTQRYKKQIRKSYLTQQPIIQQ